jgi:hypothetical protein
MRRKPVDHDSAGWTGVAVALGCGTGLFASAISSRKRKHVVNIPSAQKAELHNPPSSYEPPVAATYGRRRPFDKDFIIEQIDESIKSAKLGFIPKFMDMAREVIIVTAMSGDDETLLRMGDGSVSDPSFRDLKEYINTVLLRFSQLKE